MKIYALRQLKSLIRHPHKLWDGSIFIRLWRFMIGFKLFELDEKKLLKNIFNAPDDEIEKIIRDFRDDKKFFDALSLKNSKYYTSEVYIQDWLIILYAIVRFSKPSVMVETGVANGISSSVILKAMNDNSKGNLYSIDLPPRDTSCGIEYFRVVPPNETSGFLIPDYLRGRWTLQEGKSSDLLKPLLDKFGTVDIFMHDSDHSYQNMKFEFNLAWDYVKKGGFVLSDNSNFNLAFFQLASNNRQKSFVIYNFGILPKS